VTVVTPDRFHVEPKLAVLEAGKHLLCEKPLAVTLADARQMAVAAKKAARKGVVHMINFSYRVHPQFQKAIGLVSAGTLGHCDMCIASICRPGSAAMSGGGWTKEASLWRLQTAAGSGGVLGDVGCHILDMTTAVAGDVKRIRCDLRTYPKIDPPARPSPNGKARCSTRTTPPHRAGVHQRRDGCATRGGRRAQKPSARRGRSERTAP